VVRTAGIVRSWIAFTVALPLVAGCAGVDVPTSSTAVEGWACHGTLCRHGTTRTPSGWMDGSSSWGTDARPCPPTRAVSPTSHRSGRGGLRSWDRAVASDRRGSVPSGSRPASPSVTRPTCGSPGPVEPGRWRFVAYDAGDDRWRQLPFPAVTRTSGRGSRAPATPSWRTREPKRPGSALISRFDPSTETWDDPSRPTHPFVRLRDGVDGCRSGAARLEDATARVQGAGCLSGCGARPPDGAWSRLPDSEVIGYDPPVLAAARRERVARFGGRGWVNGWSPYPNGGMLDPVRDGGSCCRTRRDPVPIRTSRWVGVTTSSRRTAGSCTCRARPGSSSSRLLGPRTSDRRSRGDDRLVRLERRSVARRRGHDRPDAWFGVPEDPRPRHIRYAIEART
jgi:hypothetical protein